MEKSKGSKVSNLSVIVNLFKQIILNNIVVKTFPRFTVLISLFQFLFVFVSLCLFALLFIYLYNSLTFYFLIQPHTEVRRCHKVDQ